MTTSVDVRRIGLIDIGSNTIRLVILEDLTGTVEQLPVQHAHRLIEESKATVRLAGRTAADGTIPLERLIEIEQILTHFRLVCEAEQTAHIYSVATAAIRNARNCAEIVAHLNARTGLDIRILSGEEEARLGFLGVVNTIDIERGFVVDIGGGSTELTYFENRQMKHGFSIPLGAVNACKRFSDDGVMSAQQIAQLQAELAAALREQDWLRTYIHKQLPLVGLGGTCRTSGKIVQALRKYSLPVIHHYELERQTVDDLAEMILQMSTNERKQMENLGKDRADIIAPGIVILQSIMQAIGAERLVISGSGVRDGLFYDVVSPEKPVIEHLVDFSIHNLLAHYPPANINHQLQVARTVAQLFELLMPTIPKPVDSFAVPSTARLKMIMHAAAMLYQIGVSINFYQYQKHTFYLLTHSRFDGLSHRELLLLALIAAHQSKNKTRVLFHQHRDLLHEHDFELALRLGELLQLSIAFDRSKTQSLTHLHAYLRQKVDKQTLILEPRFTGDEQMERLEVRNQMKDFKKMWGIGVELL